VVLLELSAFATAAVVLSLPIGDKLSPELKGVPAVVFSSRPHVGCLLLPPLVSIIVDFMAGAFNAKVGKILHSGERMRQLSSEAPQDVVRNRSVEYHQRISLVSTSQGLDFSGLDFSGQPGLDKIMEYSSEESGPCIAASTSAQDTGDDVGSNEFLAHQKPRSPSSSAKAAWSHLRAFACCRGGPPPADDRPGQPLLPAGTNGHPHPERDKFKSHHDHV